MMVKRGFGSAEKNSKSEQIAGDKTCGIATQAVGETARNP